MNLNASTTTFLRGNYEALKHLFAPPPRFLSAMQQSLQSHDSGMDTSSSWSNSLIMQMSSPSTHSLTELLQVLRNTDAASRLLSGSGDAEPRLVFNAAIAQLSALCSYHLMFFHAVLDANMATSDTVLKKNNEWHTMLGDTVALLERLEVSTPALDSDKENQDFQANSAQIRLQDGRHSDAYLHFLVRKLRRLE